MERVFVELLNMGLIATWTVLAVMVVRALCHKAPKALTVWLWALVGIRLLIPVIPESALSLIPSGRIVSPDILTAEDPSIYTGVAMLNCTVNPMISERLAPDFSVSNKSAMGTFATPLQVIAFMASLIWIAGMAVMFVYGLGSHLWLRHKVKVSLCYRDNIYFCDDIATPFVFGVIKPRIYIPSGMTEGQMEYVVAHEAVHLKRKDHWWKTIAFFLLSVYWFHPLLWVSYMLFSRDLERACDERVISAMGTEVKKGYAEALVSCSLQKRMMLACPLAFGEVGVKNRVKAVLSYKKPAFWIVAVTVAVGIAVAVCFLTNPISESDKEYSWKDIVQGESVYPIQPGTEEWDKLGTEQNKKEACRIPDATLKKMTDAELIQAVLEFPFLVEVFLVDDHSIGAKSVYNDCDALQELLSRCTGGDALTEFLEERTKVPPISGDEEFENEAIRTILEELVD